MGYFDYICSCHPKENLLIECLNDNNKKVISNTIHAGLGCGLWYVKYRLMTQRVLYNTPYTVVRNFAGGEADFCYDGYLRLVALQRGVGPYYLIYRGDGLPRLEKGFHLVNNRTLTVLVNDMSVNICAKSLNGDDINLFDVIDPIKFYWLSGHYGARHTFLIKDGGFNREYNTYGGDVYDYMYAKRIEDRIKSFKEVGLM